MKGAEACVLLDASLRECARDEAVAVRGWRGGGYTSLNDGGIGSGGVVER